MASFLLTLLQNFFSTQFVGQEQEPGGSNKVVVSSNAWLFAAVSVPLTIATLVIWWLWVRFQAYQGAADQTYQGAADQAYQGAADQAYQGAADQAYQGAADQAYQGAADRRRGSLWRTILSRCPRRHRAIQGDIQLRKIGATA